MSVAIERMLTIFSLARLLYLLWPVCLYPPIFLFFDDLHHGLIYLMGTYQQKKEHNKNWAEMS